MPLKERSPVAGPKKIPEIPKTPDFILRIKNLNKLADHFASVLSGGSTMPGFYRNLREIGITNFQVDQQLTDIYARAYAATVEERQALEGAQESVIEAVLQPALNKKLRPFVLEARPILCASLSLPDYVPYSDDGWGRTRGV